MNPSFPFTNVVRALFLILFLTTAVCADQTSSSADGGAKRYTLRYKFQPGQTLRWSVKHQANVKTTISGTTQTAETLSESVKVWKVLAAERGGPFTIEYSVADLDMRQRLTGRKEVRYNSKTDEKAPVGFEDVAKTVGVPLSVVTLDSRGTVLKRKDHQPRPEQQNQDSQLTIPLPQQAVAVGQQWKLPYEIEVTLRDGQKKKVRTRQLFTLESVENDIATIAIETQILTPIEDKAVEAQLIQRENAGTIRFDIAEGRVVGQRMDLDKRVVGFSGPASSLHYVTRFTEELLRGTEHTASKTKPVAGPTLPPQ